MLSADLPKISVFMPVYNQAAFIHESIESVLQQDYPNYMLMIGDDASTDESPAIIKEYATRHPDKIRYYINEKNLGITGNCNKLLSQCDGEYIAFTAGDDLFMKGKLTKQFAFMQSHPTCVASYTNACVFGEGVKPSDYYGAFPKRRPYEVINGDITPFIKYRNFLAGCTIMARRQVLPPGLYNPQIKVMSDWLFFTELATQGDVLYIDELFSAYRRHVTNATWQYSSIDDFEKTYDIMAIKFPAYKKSLLAGRARLYASFCAYYLMKVQFKDAARMAKKTGCMIIQGGPRVLGFMIESFVMDCFRYTYRLVTGAWRL